MYMGILGINIHLHSMNCPILAQFNVRFWMSINRVATHIFGILRHPGSMIHTQFLWRCLPLTQIWLKAGVLDIHAPFS